MEQISSGAAKPLQQSGKKDPTSPVGPDVQPHLQWTRCYFLVPIPDDPRTLDQEMKAQAKRITQWMEDVKAPPFSDIYFVSHGWHRNFFTGVAAYDKLFSRFSALYQRGRLCPANDCAWAQTPANPCKTLPACAKPSYRPLFIAFHWNSDPEADGWIDRAGRRDKLSFMEKAALLLEPKHNGASNDTQEGLFINTLEELYEAMTYWSTPRSSVDPHDSFGGQRGADLLRDLTTNCQIRGGLGGSSSPADLTAAVWRCYNESETQRPLSDQGDVAKTYQLALETLLNLAKFLIAALGLGAVLGGVAKFFAPSQKSILNVLWDKLHPFFQQAAIKAESIATIGPSVRWAIVTFSTDVKLAVAAIWPIIAVGWGLAWLILYVTSVHREREQSALKGKRGNRLPIVVLAAWPPLQLLHTLPLLIYLFLTSLFGSWITLALICLLLFVLYANLPAWILLSAVLIFIASSQLRQMIPGLGGLFVERPSKIRKSYVRIRYCLAWFARLPLRVAHRALPPDSAAIATVAAIDNQLAFWEMQSRGVEGASRAGEWVQELLSEAGASLAEARIHFIGHSFGGLFVANAAKAYAENPKGRKIHSLTLLQGALTSSWFQGEEWIKDKLNTLACVYSGYDTANGFYYPTANNSRMAAGYVGLCGIENIQCLGKDGLFASLVQPPKLAPNFVKGKAPYYLNMDASRLIFNGPVASGGGHDDIFKDDVIHMIWAVTQLS